MSLGNSSIDVMATFLSKTYHIPDYQREYSWEAEELEDFWNDLEATRKGLEETHFFGQVVVHDDSETKRRYIIDGQQRTTTSMILLRAMQLIYGEIFEMSDKKMEAAQDQFADIRSIYLGRQGKRHLTLGGEKDNEYFENSILSCSPDRTKNKRKSQEKLRKAYVFFYDRIKELLDKVSDCDAKFELLEEIYHAFIDRFKVLYMEATKLEEAFVIFETLNARG